MKKIEKTNFGGNFMKKNQLKVNEIIQKFVSDKDKNLINSMSECILKLYEANQKLLSNQQSMFETNKVLITKLMKYEPIDASTQKRFNEYAGRGKKDDTV